MNGYLSKSVYLHPQTIGGCIGFDSIVDGSKHAESRKPLSIISAFNN